MPDPRYQQESFEPWVSLGETPVEVPLPVWNLDGVSWSDAPAPPRMHRHWPQTVIRIDGKDFARCPCSATRDDGRWIQLHQPRVAYPLGAGSWCERLRRRWRRAD